MAKSRAQIQKEYRERLKQDPVKYEQYLQKARNRKKKNFVPIELLGRKQKSERRAKNVEYVKRHRLKKKREHIAENARGETVQESGYDTASTFDTPLIVNMPFPNRRAGTRKRISRTLAQKSREYNKLIGNYKEFKKKYKSKLRTLERMKQRNMNSMQKAKDSEINSESFSMNETDSSMDTGSVEIENLMIENQQISTPGSKTKQLMSEAGLSTKQRSKIKKQLLFGCLVQNQIETKRRSIKHPGSTIISGKIISKYQLGRSINKATGIGRKHLQTLGMGITFTTKIHKRKREVERYRSRVMEFLTRDDNSRCNPGKQDKLKTDKGTRQTRTLTDYLHNLYQKFKSENIGIKLSLTSFCRIRPSYIKTTSFISRSCCLCTKHQNFTLCTQALRKTGLSVPLNPERFIADEKNIDTMKSEIPTNITFGQWKRVCVENRGKKKMMMKIVTHEMTKCEFLSHMEEQIIEFSAHVGRVKRKYEQLLVLKQILTNDEVIINMDFSENYMCKTVEEIQSAYWNMTAVTLHPTVIYYRDDMNLLQHKSIMIVSDEMGHNAATVLTFSDTLIPEIKKIVPHLSKIHYYTDSPSSQYRNKTIFRTIANHKEIYGIDAVWNFYEAGHGKSACDGLGGITKRMADEAIKRGKVTIQDAEDFYQWSQSQDCSLKAIKFVFVASTECQRKVLEISKYETKPVKGTMKVHAVVGIGNGHLRVADVSCYCTICYSGGECENHWKHEILQIKEKNSLDDDQESEIAIKTVTLNREQQGASVNESVANHHEEDLSACPGDFVAGVYCQKWYIGKVLQSDEEDGEVEISFMKQTKQLYQWPQHEDVIWLNNKDILCVISAPTSTGKSNRMFKIKEDDLIKIENAEKKWKEIISV